MSEKGKIAETEQQSSQTDSQLVLVKKSKAWIWIAAIVVLLVIAVGFIWQQLNQKEADPIKVGILHSLTGTMAISERSLVDTLILEIEKINKKGGILNRKIEAIVVDGKSDWSVFAKEAERLIVEEKVSVIFGCWTSACRKTVKPIFEKYDHLLMYPVQYEGLEESLNIIYTGAAPNQQITPAVKWAFDNLGKKFFLVGSDYVFPRTANEIIKDQVYALGGEILGEEYAILGSTDFDEIAQKIIETKPDVILNTINGDSNIAFLNSLHNASVSIQVIDASLSMPIISFSIAEGELLVIKEEIEKQIRKELNKTKHQNIDHSYSAHKHIEGENIDENHIKDHIKDHIRESIEHTWNEHVVGNYAAWNYFQSIETEQNKHFVEGFKRRYGQNRVVNDPMEAAYISLHLWAQAVEDAGTDNVKAVSQSIKGQCLDAPEGTVCVDSRNNHTWKVVRIGQVNKDGQFDIIWSSEKPIHPEPYPAYRLKTEWDQFLEDLNIAWDGKWSNPGK